MLREDRYSDYICKEDGQWRKSMLYNHSGKLILVLPDYFFLGWYHTKALFNKDVAVIQRFYNDGLGNNLFHLHKGLVFTEDFKQVDSQIFSDAFVQVKNQEDKYGLIDLVGNIIVPCEFENAEPTDIANICHFMTFYKEGETYYYIPHDRIYPHDKAVEAEIIYNETYSSTVEIVMIEKDGNGMWSFVFSRYNYMTRKMELFELGFISYNKPEMYYGDRGVWYRDSEKLKHWDFNML
ncbi:MAG TPA: hypothetical protein PL009_10345 [Flavipsychrobacter sp.]|nr:hypothetical protein [Flavipsychrobacter sp.]